MIEELEINQDEPKSFINETLIKKYMEDQNLSCLVSIFDFQRRQMIRAEDLSRAYLAQMSVLQARLSEARSGSIPRLQSRPKAPLSERPNPNPRQTPPSLSKSTSEKERKQFQ